MEFSWSLQVGGGSVEAEPKFKAASGLTSGVLSRRGPRYGVGIQVSHLTALLLAAVTGLHLDFPFARCKSRASVRLRTAKHPFVDWDIGHGIEEMCAGMIEERPIEELFSGLLPRDPTELDPSRTKPGWPGLATLYREVSEPRTDAIVWREECTKVTSLLFYHLVDVGVMF